MAIKIHLPDSLMGTGDVLARTKKPGGTWGNFVNIGAVGKFELKSDAEKKDFITYEWGKAGQVKNSAVTGKPPSISLEIGEFSKEMMSALMLGTITEIDVEGSSGSFTYGGVLAGDVIPFGYHNDITNISVTGGTVGEMTAGTNYVEKADAGYITMLTDDTSGLTVGYTFPDYTAYEISAMTTTRFIMNFVIKGFNQGQSGRRFVAEAYEAVMMPKSAIDFMGKDYAKLQLEGTLVTPIGKTTPYVVQYKD